VKVRSTSVAELPLGAVSVLAIQATLSAVWTFQPFSGSDRERIVYVGFPSENEVIFATDHGLLQWLDASTGSVLRTSRVGSEILAGVRYGSDLWFKTPHPKLVRVPLGKPEAQTTIPLASPWYVMLSDGSPYVLLSEGQDPIRVYRLPDFKLMHTISRDPLHSVWYGAGSHKSERAAIVTSQTLTVWNLRTGKSEGSTRLPLGDLTDIRFTPDDKQIAITYRDWLGTVLYDAATFRRLIGIKGTQFMPVFAPTISAMSNIGYGGPGNYGRAPRIWDVASGSSWLLDRDAPAKSVEFSPSGRKVAVAWNRAVSLYSVPRSISARWSSG
jgi:hypothetical protein